MRRCGHWRTRGGRRSRQIWAMFVRVCRINSQSGLCCDPYEIRTCGVRAVKRVAVQARGTCNAQLRDFAMSQDVFMKIMGDTNAQNLCFVR